VATVVGAIAAGESFEALLEAYGLTPEQVSLRSATPVHLAAHIELPVPNPEGSGT
jgi:Protein of unknown function (DUF433).